MKRILTAAALAALASLPSSPASAQVANGSSRDKLLVSAAWLAEHLNDRDLVILQDVAYLPLRDDLRLDHPEVRLGQIGGGLFAFPAQSNFSGVHHPLSLVTTAQSLGYHVLLDAAAFVPAHPLSLRSCPADFVAISFYKVFGYPTGVGALVARRDALESLTRPWFAGGTIDYASVQLQRHQLRARQDGFEDGTACQVRP